MNKADQLSKRNIIPRWKSINQHTSDAEALPSRLIAPGIEPKRSNDDYYFQASYEWKKEKSLLTAIELLSQSRFLGLPDDKEATDYIKKVLQSTNSLPAGIKDFFQNHCFYEIDQSKELTGIARYRKLVTLYPHDAFNWLELARYYLISGQIRKSEKALLIANQLSPNNRYIIRCLARYYFHIKEFGKALDTLRRCGICSSDPWIVASEIAISNELKVHTQKVNLARRMIESGKYDPFSLTELAGEIATIEGMAGDFKDSRKFFLQSLKKPNENSFAQAIWANNFITPLQTIDLCEMQVPDDFEGQVYCGIFSSEPWTRIIEYVKQWHNYQPFSGAPISIGTLIHDDFLHDYRSSILLCDEGLKSNPQDFAISNNLAYSYILNNEPELAIAIIDGCLSKFSTDYEKMFYFAILGMYNMRYGDIELGKLHYQDAMRICELQGIGAAVDVYWLRERKRIGEDIHNEAKETIKKIKKSKNILHERLFFEFDLLPRDNF